MGFILGGLVLVTWALVNTVVDIRAYGWAEGNYFWFCNIALFGMGCGLLIRSRGTITGFVSIASFTQIFWLLDNLYHQLTKESLFGLTDSMYQPGYPLSKFILSHYHYYTLIIGIYALCLLPRKKNKTLLLCAIFNPLIFAISYFAFGSDKNVNCIHFSCLPALIPGRGSHYSLLFWTGVFVVHLSIAYAMDWFFLRLPVNRDTLRRVHWSFGACFLLATGISLFDLQYRFSLPQITCHLTTTPPGIESGCQNTTPVSDAKFLLSYYVRNRSKDQQQCDVYLSLNGQERKLQTELTLLADESLRATAEVPNFPTDLRLEVKPLCQPLSSRSISSKPQAD